MMVESMVAISSSPDSRMARTSPVQNESLLPARKTDAVAKNRRPSAGASKLILNSTVRTSAPFGARGMAADPQALSARLLINPSLDIGVLLPEGRREWHR